MKKVIIGFLLLLAIALVGGGVYWQSTHEPEVLSNSIEAIPTSAAVIISYPNLQETSTTFKQRGYYETLTQSDELEAFFSRNALLDSLFKTNPKIKGLLSASTIWSSYHPSLSDSLLVLHVIETGVANNEKVLATLRPAFESVATINDLTINGIPCFTVSITEGPTLYCGATNGLVIIGSTKELLSSSFQQLKSRRSLLNNNSFANALKVAGNNVEANLYINYSELPSYLETAFKPAVIGNDNPIERFATWSVLDVNLKPEGFALNGFTFTNDSVLQSLSLFLEQKPQPITFPEVLPSNTASFVFYGVEDVISFSSSYKDYLKEYGKLEKMESKLDSINKLYGTDFESNLLTWMGHSFGVCITEPKTASFAEESYIVFEARSEELADKLLSDLATTLATKNEKETNPVDVNGVQINQLHLGGILAELLGVEFKAYDNPFYMILEKHVIIGSSAESLQNYLQFVQADRTLAKQLSFSRFIENLGSTFNVFSYHHLRKSRKILESYLNSNTIKLFEKSAEIIDDFEAIGTQLSTTGNSFYSNGFIGYNPNQASAEETSWEGLMDAKAAIKPVFVTNHLNGAPEVLVQDESNTLYLFNKTGQALFKTKLQEQILSEPMQVDAFKNGKLQYIFNTENFIYLVDREGSVVDGYPIKLKGAAQTNLSVFDYDNDKDYRLLITCANKRIYNYNIEGKKVNGWRHNRASDLTIHPFKHFLVSGKDYLVTGEDNGKIHLLDRTGKNRVTVEERVTPSKNNHLQLFKSDKKGITGVYITDEHGKIHHVALDGDVQPIDLGKFSPEHYFMVADLDKDGSPEFIYSDLNMLQVFNHNKKKLFEQRIDPSATKPFLVDLGSDEFGIGYCFKDPEQLILYNSKGSITAPFPVTGTSAFDLILTESERLVVSAGAATSIQIQILD